MIYIVQPFFLSILSGLVYHNAFTQTGPLIEHMKYAKHVTRDTQTVGFHVNL